jgi:hypothetical protein
MDRIAHFLIKACHVVTVFQREAVMFNDVVSDAAHLSEQFGR